MIERRTRSSVIGGVLLIVLGLAFLVIQFSPLGWDWLNVEWSWPLIIIGVGIFLLFFGLVVNAPGMAVPASIVGGIGALLYWQNLTGNWESWAYAWALIPGFVGVGIILTGLLGGGRLRDTLEGGGTLILISLILFAIFGSFLGNVDVFGPYWPALLILLGLIVLLRSLIRR
jgi:hypothetical protein